MDEIALKSLPQHYESESNSSAVSTPRSQAIEASILSFHGAESARGSTNSLRRQPNPQDSREQTNEITAEVNVNEKPDVLSKSDPNLKRTQLNPEALARFATEHEQLEIAKTWVQQQQTTSLEDEEGYVVSKHSVSVKVSSSFSSLLRAGQKSEDRQQASEDVQESIGVSTNDETAGSSTSYTQILVETEAEISIWDSSGGVGVHESVKIQSPDRLEPDAELVGNGDAASDFHTPHCSTRDDTSFQNEVDGPSVVIANPELKPSHSPWDRAPVLFDVEDTPASKHSSSEPSLTDFTFEQAIVALEFDGIAGSVKTADTNEPHLTESAAEHHQSPFAVSPEHKANDLEVDIKTFSEAAALVAGTGLPLKGPYEWDQIFQASQSWKYHRAPPSSTGATIDSRSVTTSPYIDGEEYGLSPLHHPVVPGGSDLSY
ncbi:hypothetical protein K440DRAFT_194160 [Wilcoxina mikolae CBS 423.85]|nr:hypothetical protein K440DRAFT_194160 [Wilcoxina mikolae CBS 423.85]